MCACVCACVRHWWCTWCSDGDWRFAQHITSGRRGYIPINYIADYQSIKEFEYVSGSAPYTQGGSKNTPPPDKNKKKFLDNRVRFLQCRRLHRARGHVPSLSQITWHGGTVRSKQQTKAVLTITKALTKTINFTVRAKKKCRGTTKKKKILREVPDRCPHFRARPHFQIRSGATGFL